MTAKCKIKVSKATIIPLLISAIDTKKTKHKISNTELMDRNATRLPKILKMEQDQCEDCARDGKTIYGQQQLKPTEIQQTGVILIAGRRRKIARDS